MLGHILFVLYAVVDDASKNDAILDWDDNKVSLPFFLRNPRYGDAGGIGTPHSEACIRPPRSALSYCYTALSGYDAGVGDVAMEHKKRFFRWRRTLKKHEPITKISSEGGFRSIISRAFVPSSVERLPPPGLLLPTVKRTPTSIVAGAVGGKTPGTRPWTNAFVARLQKQLSGRSLLGIRGRQQRFLRGGSASRGEQTGRLRNIENIFTGPVSEKYYDFSRIEEILYDWFVALLQKRQFELICSHWRLRPVSNGYPTEDFHLFVHKLSNSAVPDIEVSSAQNDLSKPVDYSSVDNDQTLVDVAPEADIQNDCRFFHNSTMCKATLPRSLHRARRPSALLNDGPPFSSISELPSISSVTSGWHPRQRSRPWHSQSTKQGPPTSGKPFLQRPKASTLRRAVSRDTQQLQSDDSVTELSCDNENPSNTFSSASSTASVPVYSYKTRRGSHESCSSTASMNTSDSADHQCETDNSDFASSAQFDESDVDGSSEPSSSCYSSSSKNSFSSALTYSSSPSQSFRTRALERRRQPLLRQVNYESESVWETERDEKHLVPKTHLHSQQNRLKLNSSKYNETTDGYEQTGQACFLSRICTVMSCANLGPEIIELRQDTTTRMERKAGYGPAPLADIGSSTSVSGKERESYRRYNDLAMVRKSKQPYRQKAQGVPWSSGSLSPSTPTQEEPRSIKPFYGMQKPNPPEKSSRYKARRHRCGSHYRSFNSTGSPTDLQGATKACEKPEQRFQFVTELQSVQEISTQSSREGLGKDVEDDAQRPSSPVSERYIDSSSGVPISQSLQPPFFEIPLFETPMSSKKSDGESAETRSRSKTEKRAKKLKRKRRNHHYEEGDTLDTLWGLCTSLMASECLQNIGTFMENSIVSPDAAETNGPQSILNETVSFQEVLHRLNGEMQTVEKDKWGLWRRLRFTLVKTPCPWLMPDLYLHILGNCHEASMREASAILWRREFHKLTAYMDFTFSRMTPYWPMLYSKETQRSIQLLLDEIREPLFQQEPTIVQQLIPEFRSVCQGLYLPPLKPSSEMSNKFPFLEKIQPRKDQAVSRDMTGLVPINTPPDTINGQTKSTTITSQPSNISNISSLSSITSQSLRDPPSVCQTIKEPVLNTTSVIPETLLDLHEAVGLKEEMPISSSRYTAGTADWLRKTLSCLLGGIICSILSNHTVYLTYNLTTYGWSVLSYSNVLEVFSHRDSFYSNPESLLTLSFWISFVALFFSITLFSFVLHVVRKL